MSDAKVTFHNGYFKDAAPGEEKFFSFACPKLKDHVCAFLLIRDRSGSPNRPSWIWDGDRVNPTFTPSVNHTTCWHGYIEKDRCVSVSKVDEPEPTS